MFYFYMVIILYGLSLTEAFKIKVAAQVEVSKQATDLFRDTFAKLGEGEIKPEVSVKVTNGDKPRKLPRDFVHRQYLDYLNHLKKKQSSATEARPSNNYGEQDEEDCEETVISKMKQNDQHDVHLFGNHVVKHAKTDGPLNNINL